MCILCTPCHFAWPNSWPVCVKKGHFILSSIQGKIFFSFFARASLLQWHFERFWKATARVFHMSNWWKQLIPQRQSVPGVYKGLFGTGPVQFQMVPYGHFPGKLNTIPRPKLSDFIPKPYPSKRHIPLQLLYMVVSLPLEVIDWTFTYLNCRYHSLAITSDILDKTYQIYVGHNCKFF